MKGEIVMNENNKTLPDILKRFMKNNPNMKHESLYLCESVDMDGNVIDTKIGVNLMTNYGMVDSFVNGESRTDAMKIWLGSGSTAPDPASASLTTYISNLGQGSGYTQYFTDYPREYDSTNQIWSCTMKISQQYWDYTAGSNGEYEIWEIGVGHSQTALRTHALIYDELGTQTCIVKRPNTRLYVTVFWTGSVSVTNIPQMYIDGLYVLIDPKVAIPYWGWKDVFWSMMSRGILYKRNGDKAGDSSEMNSWSWQTKTTTTVVSGDDREVHYEAGPSSSNQKFWEDSIYYITGISVEQDSRWENSWEDSIHQVNYYNITFQELMSTPEEMESYWAYPDLCFTRAFVNYSTYTGTETSNPELYYLDKIFGYSHNEYRGGGGGIPAYRWKYPVGELPCTNFSITQLRHYNYISKEWDIQIPFKNEADTVYDDSWQYVYIKFKVEINNVVRDVSVFVNKYPHDQYGTPIPKITAFDNSNMVIAATDEFWDPSTYVEITNIGSVPLALQQKRYYIIISGTVAKLNPVISRTDKHYHELQPTVDPYEMTTDSTGVIPRIPFIKSHTYFNNGVGDEDNTCGSKPLLNNTMGYFMASPYMVHFVDQNDQWTTYNLLFEDKYPGCKYRRWNTRTGDKIVIFGTGSHTDVPNGTPGSLVNAGELYAANTFGVWTLVDESTTPTKEELTITWTNQPADDRYAYNLYSWSDLGFLVVAKKRLETEFAWVDIYGTNGAEIHLVSDAKHARAIERTNYVVYQDTAASSGTSYIFRVFNMSSQEIEDTITIDDGISYEILGLLGYNNNVYIRIRNINTDIKYTYYYNISSNTLEKKEWDLWFMNSDVIYRDMQTASCEECMIVAMPDSQMIMLKDDTYRPVFNWSTNQSETCEKNIWPTINKINSDKQYILTTTGTRGRQSTVLDLGLILDGNDQYTMYYPYEYYYPTDRRSDDSVTSITLPFKDGLIRVCGSQYDNNSNPLCGRIFWFPIEMGLPMYIKGTTKTLNSYNAPTRWSLDKKLKWNITNDLSRLIPL
ncbi:MAG: hypothetical protein IKU29_00255 [Parabacteroides sp.]|nr:hypothetical protein [Parabacteroides sp.]